MKFTICISFFSLTLILIVLLGKSLRSSYYKKSIEQKVSSIHNQCNILANQLVATNFALSSDSEDNLDVEIEQLANVLDGRIIVIDSTYRVIKDTYTVEQGKFILSEDVFKVMKGKEIRQYTKKNNYLEIVVPIKNTNTKENIGAIIATISTRDIDSTMDYVSAQQAVLMCLFVILDLAISIGLSVVLTRNLNVFTNNMQHMANGYVEENIEIKGYTEMQKLAEAFNQIMSKTQKLEDSRQEFVSNVSHELKTPITSMKVLAESLLIQEDAPAEIFREFMTDIVAEIDRENQIINDLLSLIKMDKKASDLNISTVNINDLLELLLKRLRPLAQKRNIEIVFESFRPVTAEIDEVKMSLAISNLIENAIKYNVDNGWIRVSLNADHKYFYVKVADSGVGIPEDCQEQVFERFYRVDKARSRETGGTGLGLAITRNAILMHKGAIKLYSKPGEGTTFTVRIPLTYIG